MWEVCRDKVEERGAQVRMRERVKAIEHAEGKAHTVVVEGADGEQHRLPATDVISSMPLNQLVQVMAPQPPANVLQAAADLKHRDFLTVALVVPESRSFPDNWIYIHAPEVKVGRIQNFGSWSPYLVKDGRTCLGLEYFVNEGDELWNARDEDLVAMGTKELATLGLVPDGSVEAGYVVRMPKAYPVYDRAYAANVDTIRGWLAENAPNVHPVGRNGMHKYNNQDHSMYTAMLTVENIVKGTNHDVWTVNVEQDYHEEKAAPALPAAPASGPTGETEGTGRAAPIVG
jgi:protoporphyrinogen oxidase